MSIISRFFHIRGPEKLCRFKAATVFVQGDPDNVGEVSVQVTFCSRKDVFTKRIGRSMAMSAPIQRVPLRNLPFTLAGIEEEVYGGELENKNDFMFAMRYYLPRG